MKLKDIVDYNYSTKLRKTIICFGTKEYIISDPSKEYYNALDGLDTLVEDSEFFRFLQNNNLIQNPVLKDSTNDLDSRNTEYLKIRSSSKNDVINEQIENNFGKNIVIVGCGGIGTVILTNLMRCGFYNFTLIDADSVELNNLNRQLFYTIDDVGKKKVDVLERKIKEIRSTCKTKTYDMFVSSMKDMNKIISKDTAFVINGADTPSSIEQLVVGGSQKNKVPSMSVSVGLFTGMWGPIYDSNNQYTSSAIDQSRRKTLKASISMTNMAIGALAAQEIYEYIFRDINKSKFSFYTENIFDFNQMKVSNEKN